MLKRILRFFKYNSFPIAANRIKTLVENFISGTKGYLFLAKKRDIDHSFILSSGLTAKPVKSLDDISPEVIQTICEEIGRYRGNDFVENQLLKRFTFGAELWILFKENEPVCILWTSKGKTPKPFYFPITETDCFIFDIHTFRKFRGNGYAGQLLQHVFSSLVNEEIQEIYSFVKSWNKSSLRALSKTPLKIVALADKKKIFGKQIVIWHKIFNST